MNWLRSAPPEAAATPGILASRRLAGSALLRMLSRARRDGLPLLLVRLDWPAEGVHESQRRRFLNALASELRISDLAWWEPAWKALLLLLESAEAPAAPLARLEQCARVEGITLHARAAQFPRQGVTLAALLERVE